MSTSKNYTVNGSCINQLCLSDEDYIDELEEYIYPVHYEWVLIVLHCIVFVVGLTGNALVCIALYRNPSMRTVTNLMIMNLSIADFMVILVCLPPTLVWDVTETWFMGDAMCKIVLYVQTISIVVSISTLTCIALDRWYAICYPLKFASTMRRAKQAIVCIWIIAILSAVPDLVIMTTQQLRVQRPNTIYLTECNPTWSEQSEQIHQHWLMSPVLKVQSVMTCYFSMTAFSMISEFPIISVYFTQWNIVSIGFFFLDSFHKTKLSRPPANRIFFQFLRLAFLYVIPLAFMTFAYVQIFRVLWTSGESIANQGGIEERKHRPNERVSYIPNSTVESQLQSRKKAAKMLIVVVVTFALCFLPIHLLNTLRFLASDMEQTDYLIAASLVAHWLCYFNSAVNPVIYNFMSRKFRREFYSAINCCSSKHRRRNSYHPKSNSAVMTSIEAQKISRLPPSLANRKSGNLSSGGETLTSIVSATSPTTRDSFPNCLVISEDLRE